MATDNTARGGFRYRCQRNGAVLPRIELRTVATGFATAIFKGDVLKEVADGSVEWAATGSTDIYAVADGCEQYWDGQAIRRGNYLPAATAWGTVRERRSVVRCILARDAIFEADADDKTSVTGTEAGYEALIGSNVDHATGSGGSTTTGISSMSLDISTAGSAATQGWRIVGVSSTAENQDFAGSYVKLLVEVNESSQPQFAVVGV
jgi:hypothetical protein